MADTLIKENQRPRKVGGGLLVFIGLPLTLIAMRFGLSLTGTFLGILFVVTGPLLILAGLWAAFPRHPPAIKMTIRDDEIVFGAKQTTVSLDELMRVSFSQHFLSKFGRLTFQTTSTDTHFDLSELSHDAADIISQINVRLENRGKYLVEGRTDVLGARNGIWEVRTGLPFETGTGQDAIRDAAG